MTGKIRLGMSGFSYPEWIGEIYPPGTKRDKMLTAYSTIFDAVEINMTFRRRPVAATMDKWRDAVPETFHFAMKAHSTITHFKRLVGAADDVAAFVTTVQRLGDRLGPVLFQVRENTQFDESVLEAFCSALPAGCRYAFEPRNASFMTEEAHALLRKHGVGLCLNDDLFEPRDYTVTGPLAYLRFHRGLYTPDELRERADLVKRLASEADVYAFFAHEDDPESVKPALRFQELLA